MKELIGKSFDQLEPEYQRIIKRSTIPLIEFRQIGPNDYSSKYLIFERINTGSVKLNSMQIRKSLAYMSIKFMARKDAKEYNISILEKKGITEHEYGEMLNKKGVL